MEAIGTTYSVHLEFIGKRIVDFLLVLIELFSARSKLGIDSALQICHWIHILKTAWWTEGLVNKLSVFVKGPGWAPGKPRLGCVEDIPNVSILSVSISRQTFFIELLHVLRFISGTGKRVRQWYNLAIAGRWQAVIWPWSPEKLRLDLRIAM